MSGAGAKERLDARVEVRRPPPARTTAAHCQRAQAARIEAAQVPTGTRLGVDSVSHRLHSQQRSLQRRVKGVRAWENELTQLRTENSQLRARSRESVEGASDDTRGSEEEIDRSRALVRQVELLNQQLQLSVRLHHHCSS